VKPTPFGMVVRYLLLDRVTYLVLPWAWAAFGFVVDVVIVQLTPAGHTSHRWAGGLVACSSWYPCWACRPSPGPCRPAWPSG
jgi:hypothetical protein